MVARDSIARGRYGTFVLDFRRDATICAWFEVKKMAESIGLQEFLSSKGFDEGVITLLEGEYSMRNFRDIQVEIWWLDTASVWRLRISIV